jgi:hypothetical protein
VRKAHEDKHKAINHADYVWRNATKSLDEDYKRTNALIQAAAFPQYDREIHKAHQAYKDAARATGYTGPL